MPIPTVDSPTLSSKIEALPADIETCHALIAELFSAYRKEQSLAEHLQQQLEKLLRHRYGRRAETIDWENSLFAKEIIEALLAGGEEKASAQKETITYEREKPEHNGHGRQEILEHLPRVREEIDVPAEDKICSVSVQNALERLTKRFFQSPPADKCAGSG